MSPADSYFLVSLFMLSRDSYTTKKVRFVTVCATSTIGSDHIATMHRPFAWCPCHCAHILPYIKILAVVTADTLHIYFKKPHICLGKHFVLTDPSGPREDLRASYTLTLILLKKKCPPIR